MDLSLVGHLEGPGRNLQTERRYFVIRLCISCIFLAVVIANSVTGMVLPTTETSCLWDALFLLTTDLNSYLADHVLQRHLLVIFSSALIDFQVLFIATRFVLSGKSWRMPIALLSFYLFRACIQGLFIMRFPEGYLWDYPGVFSLAVSYHHTSDFFFSGHVGFTTICTCENLWLGKPKWAILSLFTALMESFVMLVCRGHYTIDLISGAVFGHYCWIVSGVLSKKVDLRVRV